MKNEENYLDEWLFYHLNIGVQHFYLYDNETHDQKKINNIIKKYSKYITLYNAPGRVQQLNAYNHCLRNHRNNTYWLATIDLDEFLVPIKENDLKNTISSYEQFSGIGFNWLVFGNNEHEKVNNNFNVIERFNKCSNPNKSINHSIHGLHSFELCSHIKTIAKTDKVFYYSNPHFAIYLNNDFACDENKQPIKGTNTKIGLAGTDFVSHNILQINHYSVKSWEEFQKRRSQPLADNFVIPDFYKSENLRNTFDKLNLENNIVINTRAQELMKSFIKNKE